MKNDIIIFEDEELKLNVNMKDETVWLNLEQLTKLFNKNRTTINRHINNIFEEGELKRKEVCAKFAHTTKHGFKVNKTQTRELDYYNLDMIISIGFRVKSQKGIIFRKWATKILKEHLIKGYTINQKRIEQLEKTVKLIDIADNIKTDNKSKEIINIINNYSKALNILDDYDNKKILKPKGSQSNQKISYEECKKIIIKLNYNSKLFGLERDKGLQSIIKDIYQTYNNQELYPSIEEKASNLLYLIIKNHVFIDGNKRIGAAIFIYFLNFYDILYKDNKKVIEDNTLVALTLLIAESNPNDKYILIDLIMNFLCN